MPEPKFMYRLSMSETARPSASTATIAIVPPRSALGRITAAPHRVDAGAHGGERFRYEQIVDAVRGHRRGLAESRVS